MPPEDGLLQGLFGAFDGAALGGGLPTQAYITSPYQHQPYTQTIAIDPAMVGNSLGAAGGYVHVASTPLQDSPHWYLDEPEPEPEPIPSFSKWLEKKYNA